MGHVEYRSWKVGEVVQCLNGGGRGHIVVPSFQRGLVWNQEKRLTFLDSIKKGLPVGVILLFVDGTDGEGRTRYRLVDGLQRCSTLNRYVENMFTYYTRDEVPGALIDAARSLVPGTPDSEEKNSLIRQRIWMWVREHDSRKTSVLSAMQLYQRLSAVLGVGAATINQIVFSACEEFVHGVQQRLDIRGKEIGVIEFSGDRGDLPVVFERLNTGGISLNKYDVLAADWDCVDDIEINNPKIVNAIKAKYVEFMNEGLEFEGRSGESIEDFNTKDWLYTLYEFVFGAGAVLRKEFPKLYGGRKEGGAQVDAVGFNLVALTNGRPISQLDKFKDDYRRYPSLDGYYNALAETSNAVQGIMAGIFNAVIDKQRRKPLHTDFQIAALVAGVFRERYETDLKERASWPASLERIREALPQRYLFDSVSAAWRGSGDSKAYAFVHNARVTEGIDATAITSALDAWFWESIKTTGKKDQLDPISEMLLKYAAAIIRRRNPHVSATFGLAWIADEATMRPQGWKTWNVANVILLSEGGHGFDPCDALDSYIAAKPTVSGDVTSWFRDRFSRFCENVATEFF